MTCETADFAMKYRVTFTVAVTDPELLLKKARAICGKFQQIMNDIIKSARSADPDLDDFDTAEIDSIEEALCWMLRLGDQGESIDILKSEAVAIGEAGG
jgi:hypothetical protein